MDGRQRCPDEDEHWLDPPTVHRQLTAFIVALFLETLLLGAFTVTYTEGASSFIRSIASGRSSRHIRDWLVLSASSTMFALACAHLALDSRSFVDTFSAFAPSRANVECVDYGPAARAFNGWSVAIAPPTFAIYVTQTLIGDALTIYRLFVVWNRNWKVIVLPSVLCLIDAACGYLSMVLAVVSAGAFFAVSFVTNITCSGLIMWRVLRNPRELLIASSVRVTLRNKVIESMIQSAAIYAIASLFLALSTYLPTMALPGLVFSFIVLRFARHSEEDVARRMPPMPVNMTRVDLGIRQPTVSPPPSVLRLRRLSSSGDAWAMTGGSTESIKRAQTVTALDSTTAVGDSDYVLPIGSPTDAPQGV